MMSLIFPGDRSSEKGGPSYLRVDCICKYDNVMMTLIFPGDRSSESGGSILNEGTPCLKKRAKFSMGTGHM